MDFLSTDTLLQDFSALVQNYFSSFINIRDCSSFRYVDSHPFGFSSVITLSRNEPFYRIFLQHKDRGFQLDLDRLEEIQTDKHGFLSMYFENNSFYIEIEFKHSQYLILFNNLLNELLKVSKPSFDLQRHVKITRSHSPRPDSQDPNIIRRVHSFELSSQNFHNRLFYETKAENWGPNDISIWFQHILVQKRQSENVVTLSNYLKVDRIETNITKLLFHEDFDHNDSDKSMYEIIKESVTQKRDEKPVMNEKINALFSKDILIYHVLGREIKLLEDNQGYFNINFYSVLKKQVESVKSRLENVPVELRSFLLSKIWRKTKLKRSIWNVKSCRSELLSLLLSFDEFVFRRGKEFIILVQNQPKNMENSNDDSNSKNVSSQCLETLKTYNQKLGFDLEKIHFQTHLLRKHWLSSTFESIDEESIFPHPKQMSNERQEKERERFLLDKQRLEYVDKVALKKVFSGSNGENRGKNNCSRIREFSQQFTIVVPKEARELSRRSAFGMEASIIPKKSPEVYLSTMDLDKTSIQWSSSSLVMFSAWKTQIQPKFEHVFSFDCFSPLILDSMSMLSGLTPLAEEIVRANVNFKYSLFIGKKKYNGSEFTNQLLERMSMENVVDCCSFPIVRAYILNLKEQLLEEDDEQLLISRPLRFMTVSNEFKRSMDLLFREGKIQIDDEKNNRICFRSHPEVDEFFSLCDKLLEGKFELYFPGEFQLLKGFDRAYWLTVFSSQIPPTEAEPKDNTSCPFRHFHIFQDDPWIKSDGEFTSSSSSSSSKLSNNDPETSTTYISSVHRNRLGRRKKKKVKDVPSEEEQKKVEEEKNILFGIDKSKKKKTKASLRHHVRSRKGILSTVPKFALEVSSFPRIYSLKGFQSKYFTPTTSNSLRKKYKTTSPIRNMRKKKEMMSIDEQEEERKKQKDLKYIFDAIDLNEENFLHVDESLRKDKDFVIACVGKNPWTILHVGTVLRRDPDVLATALHAIESDRKDIILKKKTEINLNLQQQQTITSKSSKSKNKKKKHHYMENIRISDINNEENSGSGVKDFNIFQNYTHRQHYDGKSDFFRKKLAGEFRSDMFMVETFREELGKVIKSNINFFDVPRSKPELILHRKLLIDQVIDNTFRNMLSMINSKIYQKRQQAEQKEKQQDEDDRERPKNQNNLNIITSFLNVLRDSFEDMLVIEEQTLEERLFFGIVDRPINNELEQQQQQQQQLGDREYVRSGFGCEFVEKKSLKKIKKKSTIFKKKRPQLRQEKEEPDSPSTPKLLKTKYYYYYNTSPSVSQRNSRKKNNNLLGNVLVQESLKKHHHSMQHMHVVRNNNNNMPNNRPSPIITPKSPTSPPISSGGKKHKSSFLFKKGTKSPLMKSKFHRSFFGHFAGDEKNGSGKEFDVKSNQLIFHGNFAGGLREGRGFEYRAAQDHHHEEKSLPVDQHQLVPIYEGQYLDGFRHGNGEIYDPEKQVYIRAKFSRGRKVEEVSVYECSVINFKVIQKQLKNDAIIGRGAFGIIYKIKSSSIKKFVKSKDDLTDEYVAAKIFPRDLDYFHRNFVFTRFKRAIQSISKVENKEHVLKILGVVEGFQIGYLMEIGEMSVDKLVPAVNCKIDEKFRILLETAMGMKSLHALNIMHRDLKWGNIILKNNKVKITDIDTAKEDEKDWRWNQLHTQSNIGTSSFLAPEVLAGKGDYSGAIDVYSYGLMIYALLFRIEDPLRSQYQCPGCGTPMKDILAVSIPQHVSRCQLRPLIDHGRIQMIDRGYQFLIELMKLCWDSNPLKRPRFDEIVQIFEEQKGKKKCYSICNITIKDTFNTSKKKNKHLSTSSSTSLSEKINIRRSSLGSISDRKSFSGSLDSFTSTSSGGGGSSSRLDSIVSVEIPPPIKLLIMKPEVSNLIELIELNFKGSKVRKLIYNRNQLEIMEDEDLRKVIDNEDHPTIYVELDRIPVSEKQKKKNTDEQRIMELEEENKRLTDKYGKYKKNMEKRMKTLLMLLKEKTGIKLKDIDWEKEAIQEKEEQEEECEGEGEED